MWEMGGVFSSMVRTLNHYHHYQSKYRKKDFHPPVYLQENSHKVLLDPLSKQLSNNSLLNAASIWYTFKAMVDVSRPEQQRKWELFSSSQKIAWKTGTSYGYRDAWAIGITPKNIVVVWTGNADGEGRPNLIGIESAAPILFDVFKVLKPCSWFDKPYDDMQKVTICKKSGHLASEICNDTITTWIQKNGIRTKPCPYHQLIHLDKKGKRVSSICEEVSVMEHKPWFVLPPAMEWFYKSRHPGYHLLPPYREGCRPPGDENVPMQLIYPKYAAKIYVPTELDGKPGETVFELAHRIPKTTVYWHLDDQYIGKTSTFHQIGLKPSEGKHIITVIDEDGEKLVSQFEVIGENEK
jgi:penicillin-binding protein 1C